MSTASIAVLLSGGVDSSVALCRLRSAGHRDLQAFYLKIWLEDELADLGSCPWEEDLGYARQVCAQMGVELEVVPMQREYQERVVRYVVDELRAGRTPSPDLFCNERVKFGAFLDTVGSQFGRVASGHYARIEERGGRLRLLRGVDRVKDQTYFLARLSGEQLRRCLFPIGALQKCEVRAEAERQGLANCARRDSQGICFLGKIPFDDFVERHLGVCHGAIVEAATGRRLGEHRGYWFHTIGQRRGLGLSGGPWFVSAKRVEDNVVEVTHGERLRASSRDRLTIADVHWISAAPETSAVEIKLRHGPETIPARIEAIDADRWHVRLASADPGIAPGQFVIVYDGDECLGAGAIEAESVC